MRNLSEYGGLGGSQHSLASIPQVSAQPEEKKSGLRAAFCACRDNVSGHAVCLFTSFAAVAGNATVQTAANNPWLTFGLPVATTLVGFIAREWMNPSRSPNVRKSRAKGAFAGAVVSTALFAPAIHFGIHPYSEAAMAYWRMSPDERVIYDRLADGAMLSSGAKNVARGLTTLGVDGTTAQTISFIQDTGICKGPRNE